MPVLGARTIKEMFKVNLNQVKELFEYDAWANAKLLNCAETSGLTSFTRELGGSFSSMRDTFVHILGVEELWLSRWQGETGRLLDPQDFSTPDSLRERWHSQEHRLNEYLSRLGDNDLAQIITYKNIHGITYSLELWKQILHLSNHSAYHRGQVVTMMRQLNIEPPSTDLIYFYLGQR